MREAKSTPAPSPAATADATSSSDGSGATSADQTPSGADATATATKAAETALRMKTHDRGSSRASSSYAYAGGSSSYASSSSSSFSYDPDTVGNDPGWTSEFPCQFYPPDADGCAAYRSCYDCLNEGIIYKGRGCYVNPSGRCLDLATAKLDKTADVDFRNATASNNASTKAASTSSSTQSRVYFPSRAAKYCAMSDTICQKCKRTIFQDVIENEAKDGLSNFCLGHNNCVCVAVCESPNRAELLGGLVCNGKLLPGHSGSSNQASSQANRGGLSVNANITWLVGIPLVGVIMAVVLVSYNRKNRPRNHHLTRDVSLFGDRPFSSVSGMSDSSSDSSMSSMSSRGSSSLSSIDEEALPSSSAHSATGTSGSAESGGRSQQLNLVGWRALRNELIVREQQLLAGRQDFSSVGYVQLLDTSSASSVASSTTSGEGGRESDDGRHPDFEGDDDHVHSSVDIQTLSVLGEGDGEEEEQSVVARGRREDAAGATGAHSFDDDVSML